MNKKILILSLVSALVGGGAYLLSAGKSDLLSSWVVGVLLGIYPFAFWQAAHGILSKFYGHYQAHVDSAEQGKKKSFLYYFMLLLVAIKFIIIALLAVYINALGFIKPTSFLAGFLVMAPIVLALILINYFSHSSAKEALRR